ncbi:MAG TPA: peptidylprolyl isomerase [Stellaceae bacterium]|nr:peptidylprolyl isomerase [Stellaceae bacterium]
MMHRSIFALLVMLTLLGPALAQSGAKAGDPVVARVNGTEIHRSEVEALQRQLPAQLQKNPIEQLYPRLLDSLISNTLLSQAAKKAKLNDDAEVKKRVAQIRDRIVQQVYIERLVSKGGGDKKLHELYDEDVKNLPKGEEVHARHILLATEQEAKDVIADLDKGADFVTLAKEKTTDNSGKTTGGDLGYFTKEQMVPEFADAAFKLKKGEITHTPVKSQFGWHVIKLEDRRTAKPPTFEQAKPQLENQLSQELVNAKIKELATSATIEVFLLDGSRPPARTAPPSAPPGTGAAPGTPPAAAPPGPVTPPPAPSTSNDPPPPTLSPATAPDQLEKH